jgi:Kef-type K+ transport system membrane component KefB
LPRVAGFLLIGIVIGPYGASLIERGAMLDSLRLVEGLAVALIALSAGGEIKIDWLRSKLVEVTIVCLVSMVVIFSGMLAIMWMLRGQFEFLAGLPAQRVLPIAALFGVISLCSSPMIAIALINETKSDGPLARMILGCTVMKDILVILAFTFTLSLTRAMLGDEGSIELAEFAKLLGMEIFGSIAIGLLTGAATVFYLRHLGREMPLMVILLCFFLAMLGDLEHLHLSTLLMGLSAGFYVENFSHRREAHDLIRGVERLSLPIYCLFFAMAGLKLPITELLLLWQVLPLLVLGRAGLIWMGTLAAVKAARCEPVVQRHLWTGMMSQAGVSLAMAKVVADSFPVWGAAAQMVLVAMVATNEMAGPLLLNRALVRSGEATA